MILCITNERLPGIRSCSVPGEHKISCPDRPVNRAIAEHEHGADGVPPERCSGCLPRGADRGYLCTHCYDRVETAHMAWGPFARLVVETEGRTVSPDGGGVKSAAADGYTNLPLTFLAIDECERHLRSLRGLTLDAWVHTETGARDAIQFAQAAENAYRSLEVEAREVEIVRKKCPHCGRLTITGHNTRQRGNVTIVECQWCGMLLTKVRPDSDRWVGSDTCRHATDGHGHVACTDVNCGCFCHELGARSGTAGVESLWNADLHTWAPASAPREDWIVDDAHTIHHDPTFERKSA